MLTLDIMYSIFNICMVHEHDAQAFAICYKCLFICRYQVAHGFGDDEIVLKEWASKLWFFYSWWWCKPTPHSLSCHHKNLLPSVINSHVISCLNKYHWGSRPCHYKSGMTSKTLIYPSSHTFPLPHNGVIWIKTKKSSGHLPNSPWNLIFYHCSEGWCK